MAQEASQQGIGNCGDGKDGNTHSYHRRSTPNRTSLQETILRNQNSISSSSSIWSETTTYTKGASSSWLYRITLRLQAYNHEGQAQTKGGDEFVGTVTGWSYDGVAFQTARVWTDLGNGTYTGNYLVPRFELVAFRVTLLHYYTCYDGFVQYTGKTGASTHRLKRGPMTLLDDSSSRAFIPPNPVKDAPSLVRFLWEERNVCESSQLGIEQLTDGIWMESSRINSTELTLNAVWTPFCCRPPTTTNNNINILRIGSSTMPNPTLQVGDVYDIGRTFHNKWIPFLWRRAPLLSDNDTVTIVSAGLHQLFNGYRPADCAQLILRMICQLTYRYKGRVVVVGPVPIQQHLYDRVDMTDMNVMWINALLHHAIQVEADGQLDRICMQRTDLAQFQTVPRMGSILEGDEAEKVLERLRAKLSFRMTADEIELTKFLESTEERARVYGNRSIWFANMEHFLRPRPETYVAGDKIHDKRGINGTSLFQGAHATLMDQLGTLRAGARP